MSVEILVPDGMMERLKCMVSHKVDEEALLVMGQIRQKYIDLAVFMVGSLPESRSKSLALTYLEDSLMRSIQAISHRGEAAATGYV